MELINLDDVKKFVNSEVELSIHDQSGADQASAVRKTIKKVSHCPDKTHVRFYFDDFYFLAVPLASQISELNGQWSAYDSESGLTYNIKKVQVF